MMMMIMMILPMMRMMTMKAVEPADELEKFVDWKPNSQRVKPWP